MNAPAEDVPDEIKSMGLYRNVERILVDLEASGHKPDSTLRVSDLTAYDQLHYEGTRAVDDAIAFLSPAPGSRVLDIGSGLGGPVRYFADRTEAHLTALEIQADLHAVAGALTERCGLSSCVSHVLGDVTVGDAGAGEFSGIMSMLCFLHIPDRAQLFSQCARALKKGGRMFIDDYYARRPLGEEDAKTLRERVFCPYLPAWGQYKTDVEVAGFDDVVMTDKTEEWKSFVVRRLVAFRERRAELVGRHGARNVDDLDAFYSAVVDLFVAGRLGGLRLTATKSDSTS